MVPYFHGSSILLNVLVDVTNANYVSQNVMPLLNVFENIYKITKQVINEATSYIISLFLMIFTATSWFPLA